jgi:hypothetical protein
MGCRCKGGKLNNLDSLDHLKLASDVYNSVVVGKDLLQLDEFDQMEIFSTYAQLYPNQKIKPTLEQAIGQLKEAHERYTQKR